MFINHQYASQNGLQKLMLKYSCKPLISLQGTGRDLFHLFECIQSAGPPFLFWGGGPISREFWATRWQRNTNKLVWLARGVLVLRPDRVSLVNCPRLYLQDRGLCLYSRHFCASSFHHPHHPRVYLVQGKHKAKTNKHTSSVFFHHWPAFN